jgi:hypothetical protein
MFEPEDMFGRRISSVRFRRWLYIVTGLLVVAVCVGAWIEQSAGLFLQDGTQSLFNYYPIWLAFVAVVVVAPFALYDYLRWLFETHAPIGMRLAGVGVLGLGFLVGIAVTGWDGCVVESDGPMDTVVS